MPVEVNYKGVTIANDLRLDLLVNNSIAVELKSVETVGVYQNWKITTYVGTHPGASAHSRSYDESRSVADASIIMRYWR